MGALGTVEGIRPERFHACPGDTETGSAARMSQNPPPYWGAPRDEDPGADRLQPPPPEHDPYGGYYHDGAFPPGGSPPYGYGPGGGYQPGGDAQPADGYQPYGGYQPDGGYQPYQYQPYGPQPVGAQPYSYQPYGGYQFSGPGYGPFGRYQGQYGPLAGWWRRVGATVIDLVVLTVPWVVVFVVIAPFSADAALAVGLLLLPSGPLYYIALIAKTGQTVGNRVVGTRVVVARTGAVPGWGKAAGLYFMALLLMVLSVLFVGLSSFVDILWPLWDDDRQTLHDKAVGTIVVIT